MLLLMTKNGNAEWIEIGSIAPPGADAHYPDKDMLRAIGEVESAALTSLSRPGL